MESVLNEVKISERYYKVHFTDMTIYQAQLTYMKKEDYTYKKIAETINKKLEDAEVSEKMVEAWFNRESQPKNRIIKFLETELLKRLEENQRAILNPDQAGIKNIFQ